MCRGRWVRSAPASQTLLSGVTKARIKEMKSAASRRAVYSFPPFLGSTKIVALFPKTHREGFGQPPVSGERVIATENLTVVTALRHLCKSATGLIGPVSGRLLKSLERRPAHCKRGLKCIDTAGRGGGGESYGSG